MLLRSGSLALRKGHTRVQNERNRIDAGSKTGAAKNVLHFVLKAAK